MQRLGDVLFQNLAVALLQELNEAGELEKMPDVLYNGFYTPVFRMVVVGGICCQPFLLEVRLVNDLVPNLVE